MCLIISMPNKEAFITDEDLRSAINRNCDGMGVMYPVTKDGNTELVVEYNMGTEEEQFQFFKEHRAKSETTFVCHVRWATDGAINVKNCHPHAVTLRKDGARKDYYLVHNGIISKHSTTKSAENSDTVEFINNILKPLMNIYPNLIKSKEFNTLVSEYIGSGSKLVLMDGRGKLFYVNKDKGIERNGAWLSNSYSVTNDNKVKQGVVYRDGKTWNSIKNVWEEVPKYGNGYGGWHQQRNNSNSTGKGWNSTQHQKKSGTKQNTTQDTATNNTAQSSSKGAVIPFKLSDEERHANYLKTIVATYATLTSKHERLLAIKKYRMASKFGDPTFAVALRKYKESETAKSLTYFTDSDHMMINQISKELGTMQLSEIVDWVVDEPEIMCAVLIEKAAMQKSSEKEKADVVNKCYTNPQQFAQLLHEYRNG